MTLVGQRGLGEKDQFMVDVTAKRLRLSFFFFFFADKGIVWSHCWGGAFKQGLVSHVAVAIRQRLLFVWLVGLRAH